MSVSLREIVRPTAEIRNDVLFWDVRMFSQRYCRLAEPRLHVVHLFGGVIDRYTVGVMGSLPVASLMTSDFRAYLRLNMVGGRPVLIPFRVYGN